MREPGRAALPALSGALALAAGAGAKSQCHFARELTLDAAALPVSFSSVLAWESSNATYLSRPTWWSFAPCSVTQTLPVPMLAAVCGTPNASISAYAFRHSAKSFGYVCEDAYDQLLSGPEEIDSGAGGLRWELQSSATGSNLTLEALCNPAGENAQAVLRQDSAGSNAVNVTYPAGDSAQPGSWTATLFARRACRLNERFCSAGKVYCSNRTLACLGSPGVCADASCLSMTTMQERADPSTIAGADVYGSFTVQDCRGMPVPGLSTADFTVHLDGVAVDPNGREEAALVRQRPQDSARRALAVGIDQSGSITLAGTSAALRNATQQLLTAALPASPDAGSSLAGLFAFDGGADLVALPPSFTPDRAELIATAQQLPYIGQDQRSTNLYGAVVQAIDAASQAAAQLDAEQLEGRGLAQASGAVVIITDGRDTSQRVTQAASVAAIEAFRRRNGTVFVVGLGPDISDAYLTSLVGPGSYYIAEDTSDLGELFGDVGRQLSVSTTRYFLGKCSPRRSGVHAMSVALTSAAIGGAAPPQPLHWVYNAATLRAGCTADTLQQAADAFDNITSTAGAALPTVSAAAPTIALPAAADSPAYFQVDLSNATNPTAALSFATTPTAGAGSAVYIASTSGNCTVPTAYCYDSMVPLNASAPSLVLSVSGGRTLKGFAALAGAAGTVSVALDVGRTPPPSAAPTPPSPTASPNAVVPAPPPPPPPPATPAAADDDDGGIPWYLWLIVGVTFALCLLAVCWAYVQKQKVDARSHGAGDRGALQHELLPARPGADPAWGGRPPSSPPPNGGAAAPPTAAPQPVLNNQASTSPAVHTGGGAAGPAPSFAYRAR
eukprot:TRINITY_DN51182_c0_g1_i1.p1 TRINITY_DN51182_c0_g1~~TRINITY_DN51182_c0_g1_i1.p1  ORF type:complete len:862 (+),score=241.59 TRINITY_DN51182_c0_g1_i1:67-2586(+)